MYTTLNEIRKHRPCAEGWEKLLSHLGKSKADDDELSLITILESNGLDDAIWCLRCFEYKDYCLFLADIAESVIDIYENKYPDNKAPRLAIDAIRDYHAGIICADKLKFASDAAHAASADATSAYAASAAAYAAAYADARNNKLIEIERLFIKHFK